MILCIDDMPMRYLELAQLLQNEYGITTVVTCRMEEVKFYLEIYKVIGVCLDHDMPFQNGLCFAETFLAERNIPVLITSQNPGGSAHIKYTLDEYEVRNLTLPYLHDGQWLQQALRFFELDQN